MKLKDLFWWLGPPKIIFVDCFGWLILLIIVFAVPFLRIWWWLITPIVLLFPLKTLYLWWVGWDYQYYQKLKWVILEIIPPKEVLAPFKAMEDVFTTIWAIIDTANWREIYCDGELPIGPYWASFEIASIEGKIHFYIRCLTQHRHIIESVFYSHYPETEIVEVSDYTKNVPQNVPNKEWDFYGSDFFMEKPSPYPIRTYSKFFEPSGERIAKEEKRIDPITSLLEDMARLGPGEQCWFQIVVVPIDKEIPWVAEGKKIAQKIARRPEEKKPKTIFEEFGEVIGEIISGPKTAEQKAKEKALSPARSEAGEREMIITPGEREILTAIEEKIRQRGYKTNIRGIYLAKRDVFKDEHRKIVEGYFPHFYTLNLNTIRYSGATRTKLHYVWRGRRKYVRQRRMLRLYQERFPPYYPKLISWPLTFVLSPEELATIYHFPTKIGGLTVPTVTRVEAKKGGPPAELPTE